MLAMHRSPADPQKLLAHWMEWERGEVTPGDLLKNLKVGGMRDLLDKLAGAPSSDIDG